MFKLMSKKKASASSREPSTGKQKRHSSVSTCLESVVKYETQVFDMSKNETVRNYVCFLWYCIVSMSSVNQYNISLSSPHKCLISGELNMFHLRSGGVLSAVSFGTMYQESST